MAETKDFNPNRHFSGGGKTKENVEKTKSMNSMIARHRRLKLYTVLMIASLFAAIVIGLYINWKNMVYVDYEVIQQSEWARPGESKCINLSGTLLTYSNNGMSCTDTKGKVIWNQTYEMQNPIIRTCNKTVAVGDYNGRSIYVSNTEKILGNINVTMPIRDFCVSSNGIVAAVLDDSSITAIYLYSVSDENPLVYFKTSMSQSGYPIAVDISNDGTQVAVSYIKAEDGKISSSIGFYNFSAVGQNYTDNLVSGYGYSDAVVPMVHFMNNASVFAAADNRLMFFEGRQKPENVSDILIQEEIQSVFYNDNYVGLVFFNSSGETNYRMEIYDTKAKKTGNIEFDLEYTDILFGPSSIIIYNDNECVIYDWDMKLKFSGIFKDRIICILPSGNISRYTLVTDDSVQLINLQ